MRILFNHGLTPEELYTNVPDKIINRKWTWFIKRYGSSRSYNDAISDPFKYAINIILNKIINEKLRFKLPVKAIAYIDFEIVKDDKFETHRQRGRFQDIDFVESDFTGYMLRYYYKGKADYIKDYPVYLGGDLKKKFINNINSGEKYYTINDFKLEDVLPEIHEKFKDLTKKELSELIKIGFRRMHSSLRFGCAITINTKKFGNCYVYIGTLSLNPIFQIKDYVIRRNKKLRKIWYWERNKFTEEYYVGLNEKSFLEWVKLNKNSRSLFYIKSIIVKKIKEEFYYSYKNTHIFKIKVKKTKKWALWFQDKKIRDVEYLGYCESGIFTPSNITWKELIKENEKRSS